MKKFLICLFVALFAAAGDAQVYFDYHNNHFPTVSNTQESWRYGDGSYFEGTAYRIDSVINSYSGKIHYPDGSYYEGGLDKNKRLTGGTYYDTNGKRWNCVYSNGQLVSKTEVQPVIYNGSYDSGHSGGNYNSGSSGSNYTNPVQNHTATCRGCNASGRCQHCKGSGLSSTGRSKCSLCHGSGRCVSCGGTGHVRM